MQGRTSCPAARGEEHSRRAAVSHKATPYISPEERRLTQVNMEPLLKLLRQNALESPRNLAKMLDMDEAAVRARIEEYERKGIIRGYQAVVNEDQLHLNVVHAAIEVKVTPEREGGFDRIAERIGKFPEVDSAVPDVGPLRSAALRDRPRPERGAGRFSWPGNWPRWKASRPPPRAPAQHVQGTRHFDEGDGGHCTLSLPVNSSSAGARPAALGIATFFDIVSTRRDVISLGIGEPDFVTPWHVREAAIVALERGATSYTSNRGLLRLRKAIAAYVERMFASPTILKPRSSSPWA